MIIWHNVRSYLFHWQPRNASAGTLTTTLYYGQQRLLDVYSVQHVTLLHEKILKILIPKSCMVAQSSYLWLWCYNL